MNETSTVWPRVLVTGEFWHTDFAGLLNGLEVSTTFVRLDKLLSVRELPDSFTAVIVAQSRRNSISQEAVDHIRGLLPNTPQIALLGSWCEGEQRSGEPLKHVTRVLWHQWQGEFAQLADMLNLSPSCPLEEIPRRIRNQKARMRDKQAERSGTPAAPPLIGVSAGTLTQFEMVADALTALECQSLWIERTAWDGIEPPATQALVLDSDSLSENLTKRLVFLRSFAPQRPVVLLMNFPRSDEVSTLQTVWNVDAVVSKPFDLRALYFALRQAGVQLHCSPPKTTPATPPIAPTNSVPTEANNSLR